MNDERLGTEIGDFYRETDVAPPDSKESARQVAARAGQTPQVSRRRWLPTWLDRWARQRATTPIADERGPGDAPQTHESAVRGRTRTMFNPTTAITAGVLVVAIGGALFVAQPFSQPDEADPPAAAVDGPAAPVEFDGYIEIMANPSGGSLDSQSGLSSREGMTLPIRIVRMSDPRLAGTGSGYVNTDLYTRGQVTEIWKQTLRIENADGAWVSEPMVGVTFPREIIDPSGIAIFHGEGDYAGLVAIAELHSPEQVGGWEVRGVVIDGELPTDPDPR